MKRGLFIVLTVLLLVSMAYGEPVRKQIPFSKTTGLAAGTYTFRFSLWDASTGGTQVWWEIQDNITVSTNKTIKTTLGIINPLNPADFSQQLWVLVERETTPDTWLAVGGRTKLNVVPYALWSETSDETDPQVNTLTANLWCASNAEGTAIDCTKPAPALAGHDHDSAYVNEGQADSIASGMIVNGTIASADVGFNYAGSTSKGGPATNLACAGCVSQSELSFTPLLIETDPQVGTLTNGKWCSTDGLAVNCIQEPPAPANHNHNSSYVNVTGDKMSGVLELPLDGLVAGTNQLVLFKGMVGIGTPTPSEKLVVQGNIQVQNAGNTKNLRMRTSGAALDLDIHGSNLYIGGDSGYIMFMHNSEKNIGIGTVTPGAKLDVLSTVPSGKAVLGTATGATSIGVEGHGTHAAGYFKNANGTGQAFLGFKYQGTADYGIQTWSNHAGCWCQGDYAGGFFDDTNSSAMADVAVDTYKIWGNGSVNFVQNHPNEKDKVIVYTAPEGDEVATYTRGTARLVRGEARIQLGETFKWVTNPDIGLTAHLTPRGNCKGLYVESLSTTEMVVRELQGGTSNIVFDYMVYGLRIGFEEASIVQEKKKEAYIPSMASHRERYNKNPELRHYNALERYKDMSADIRKPVDLSNSKALHDAIIEFDPAVHKVPRP